MNCANHPETPATAFCRECGKPMCVECQRPALGSVYCQEHVPATTRRPRPPFSQYRPRRPTKPPPASPYSAADPALQRAAGTARGSVRCIRLLALILGFCPGVGAIYNGQYAKGLVHAVIFGLLVTMASNTHNGGMAALLGIMIGVWVIYQAFEAYHTARQAALRRRGWRSSRACSKCGTGTGDFPSAPFC